MKKNNYKAPSASYLKMDFEGMICISGGGSDPSTSFTVSQNRYGEAQESWGYHDVVAK